MSGLLPFNSGFGEVKMFDGLKMRLDIYVRGIPRILSKRWMFIASEVRESGQHFWVWIKISHLVIYLAPDYNGKLLTQLQVIDFSIMMTCSMLLQLPVRTPRWQPLVLTLIGFKLHQKNVMKWFFAISRYPLYIGWWSHDAYICALSINIYSTIRKGDES